MHEKKRRSILSRKAYFFLRGTVAGLTLCFLSILSIAQTGSSGTVQGTITDPSNAVIAGAKVTVTNINTGVKNEASSTSAGYYVVPSLMPGLYTISVEKTGFQVSTHENVQINALQVVGLNVRLTVGSTAESITVTTAPPALETENASMTTTMENETYTVLPLNMGGQQRDPTAFASLTPGYSGGGRSGTYNGAGGASNGSSSSGAITYIDGLPVSQGDNRQISLAISVDAVDQFQVTSSGANAAQTGMGSQNYNVKHGTNSFHGSLYDYMRNTAFDSWNFFAKAQTVDTADGGTRKIAKPAEHQTELGLTFGGPIKKNKMFLFLSGEVYRYTAYVNPTLMTVPTLAIRSGDFSALPYKIYDPASLKVSGSTYKVTQFPNNKIPSSRISSISQNMQSFLPNPSNSDLTDNYLSSHMTGNSNYEMTERFDWVLNSRHRLSVLGNVGKRGFIGYDYNKDATLPVPYVNGVLVTQFMDSGILEHTFIATPNLVNQVKFGYVRMDGPVQNPSASDPRYKATAMGIGNIPAGGASDNFPAVTFSGGKYGYSAWYSPTGYKSTNNQFIFHDDLSWVRGKHSITVGLDFSAIQKNASSWLGKSAPLSLTYSSSPTKNFASSSGTNLTSTSGDSYATYLLGGVTSTSITVANYSTLGYRAKPFSPYIQDDWKIKPNLTLNLGLRWDLFRPLLEVLDRGSFMNPNIVNPATGTYGAMMYLGNGVGSCNCHTPANTYFANIGPRLGFAYAPTTKTVIRGGFTISYSRHGAANAMTGTSGLSKKTSYTTTINGEQPAFYLNPGAGNSNFPTWSSTITKSVSENAGNYYDSTTGTYPVASGVSMADPYRGGRVPTVYNWNFGLQRAITNNLTVSATYAGSSSHFLSSDKSGDINELDPKYNVIGQYLSQLPGSTNSATGRTYLADAQARYPGIALPYSSYGGSSATISKMLTRFPQYGSVTSTWGATANADYHALQMTLNQKNWHGLIYTVNFTYSKAMDNTGSYRASGDMIPANIFDSGKAVDTDAIEHSPTVYDQPFVLKFFGSYKLPFGKGEIGSNNRYTRQIGQGWQLAWIYSIASGRPLTFGTPSYNPNFSGKVRINGKYGNGYRAGMSNSPRYINSDAFILPARYKIGDLARTAPYGLRYPHSSDIDLSIMRTFDISKQHNVKFNFRAEVFNLTNHTEFKGIGTSYPCTYADNEVDFGQGGGTCQLTSSDKFGRVSSQNNDARDWQFSGKISF